MRPQNGQARLPVRQAITAIDWIAGRGWPQAAHAASLQLLAAVRQHIGQLIDRAARRQTDRCEENGDRDQD